MNKDIAIIGLAGRFPDADNLDELTENLKQGRDSVREISGDRVKNTTLPPDRRYKVCGYLEDIDKFDYRLFNLSPGEAQTMGPAQRLLLEIAYHTLESSGYSLEYFSGSLTSVFIGLIDSDYYAHADEFVETLISGNVNEYFAPRISRQFNLRGNSLMINASCASSLVAVDTACGELRLGNADYALVCAVNIDLFPFLRPGGLNLESPDGKSRAFSDQANGMSFGEAAVGILLKPLDRALKDGDMIHAVIKGSAVNNNANRSASPTAPDSFMQAEVIKEAWRRAGIDPLQVGYIEAHGSGTQLGDSLEIEGLNLAFREFTQENKICPLSTVKSNIGHGRPASGLVGLIRTVLCLKHRLLFPTPHFNRPNPIIDFDHAAVYVNTELKRWEAKNGRPRLAGVTSIGANGVNCHLVLQEAPQKPGDKGRSRKKQKPGPCLVCVSSRSLQGLKENLEELLRKLDRPADLDLWDIGYTLNKGRKHYEHRFAACVSSLEELKQAVAAAVAGPLEKDPARPLKNLIFILADHRQAPTGSLAYFLRHHPVFKENYLAALPPGQDNRPGPLTDFSFQYALYRLLDAYGIRTERILSIGIGKILGDVIGGKITLDEGRQKASAALIDKVEDIPGLKERVDRLLDREVKSGPVAFIDLGGASPLATELQQRKQVQNGDWHIWIPGTCRTDGQDPLLELFRSLYLAGYDIDWSHYFRFFPGRRIALPGYRFEKTRCWLRDEPKKFARPGEARVETPAIARQETGSELEEKIARAWQEVLPGQSFSLDDDFFDLGGDSLMASRVIKRIDKELGLRLSFEDMFDFPTIRSLARHIDHTWGTEEKVIAIWQDVLKLDRLKPTDNFFDLGGHSLMANQILNLIKKRFGQTVNFEEFFAHPTIQSLARFLDERLGPKGKKGDGPDLVPGEKKGYYKLSPAQKRMSVLHQIAPHSIYYNTPVDFVLDGEIDRHRLERSFRELIQRHEILRTAFQIQDNEEVQKVQDTVDFSIDFRELGHEENPGKTVEGFIRPFDLSRPPLMRVLLLKTGPERHIFVLDMHHIIIDGFSFTNVFVPELTRLYQGADLPPLAIQYRDYSEWQNTLIASGEIARQEAYWLAQFADGVPRLNLPGDFPRPRTQVFDGKSIDFTIDADKAGRLKTLCKSENLTTFMAVLAVFTILLSRLSGQEDIVVGTPIAGRRHADLDQVIGLFVNVLAQRNFPVGSKTIREFLREIKERSLASFENQDYPFEDLVERLARDRDPGRSPLFDVMLLLQNFGAPLKESGLMGKSSLKVSPYTHENTTARYDLLLFCSERQEGLFLSLEYNTHLFKAERVENMIADFKRIMDAVIDNQDTRIEDIASAGTPPGQQALYRDVEFNL